MTVRQTNMGFDSKLMALAGRAAEAEGLDPAVVCAVVEQESGWNTWALRYEPLFFAKYVAPLYTNNKVGATEAYAREFSWGLIQVMGQTAREMGLNSLHLSMLCDPAVGLTTGCKILRKKLEQRRERWPRGWRIEKEPGPGWRTPRASRGSTRKGCWGARISTGKL